MAKRPVFVAGDEKTPVERREVTFVWNPGLSKAQKQRNITALHAAAREDQPALRVLEISSKSLQPEGVLLSAFNLTRLVPSLGKRIPLECIFQGSKVFTGGGPYQELYEGTSREAKRDPRLRENGLLLRYHYEAQDYPAWPRTAFYNWQYACALLENPALMEAIVQYDAFTDIEFNPERSKNCQAEAAAVFVTLHRRGLLAEIPDFSRFVKAL